MEIKAFAEVTMPGAWTDENSVPTLTVKLQNNAYTYADPATENCSTNTRGVENVCFDIHPGSAYAYGSSASDKGSADGLGVENIILDASNVAEDTDICTEKW